VASLSLLSPSPSARLALEVSGRRGGAMMLQESGIFEEKFNSTASVLDRGKEI